MSDNDERVPPPSPTPLNVEGVIARLTSMQNELGLAVNPASLETRVISLASDDSVEELRSQSNSIVAENLRHVISNALSSGSLYAGSLSPEVITSISMTHRETLGRAGTRLIIVPGRMGVDFRLEQTRLITCGPMDYEMSLVFMFPSTKICNFGKWLNPPAELATEMRQEVPNVNLPFHPYSNGRLVDAAAGKLASTCIGTASSSAWPNLQSGREWPSMFDLVYQILRRPPRVGDPSNTPYYQMEAFELIFKCMKCGLISTPIFVGISDHLSSHRADGVSATDPDMVVRTIATGHEQRLSPEREIISSTRRRRTTSSALRTCQDTHCNQCWEDIPQTTMAPAAPAPPPAIQPRCRGCGQFLAEGDDDILQMESSTFHTPCAEGWFICVFCDELSNSESDDYPGMCESCGDEHFTCVQCERTGTRDGSVLDTSDNRFCDPDCLVNYHTA